MASSPPKKNTAFSFEVALPSVASSGVFQVNPTLAAGDVKVSKDGGAFSNITSLPTAISSGAWLTVALSATEMNADRIVVMFHDAAGAEWCDVSCLIFTVSQQIDDLASQASANTIAGYLDTEIAAIKAKTDNLPASPAATGDIPTAIQNADALLDRANGVETGLTPRNALRLQAAATAGKLSGAATNTNTIRNAVADSKDRITATVDADGNRTAITYDLT